MATNDFLPFAAAGGANVVDQATYAAGSYRTAGYSTGIAQSNQLNKTWRQSGAIASALAAVLSADGNAGAGVNFLDDGNATNLAAAIRVGLRSNQISTITSTSAVGNVMAGTLTPAITSYAQILNVPLVIKWIGANTAATTLNINGLGGLNVIRTDGSALAANDIQTNAWSIVMYTGSAFQFLSLPGSFNGNWVKTSGDTMTGVLHMNTAGINYNGVGDGHSMAFGWNGSYVTAYVDTTAVGALAYNATFANYLPLTGGTLSGDLYEKEALYLASNHQSGWTLYFGGVENIYRERIDGWLHAWSTATGTWRWASPTDGNLMYLDGSGLLFSRNGYSTPANIAASGNVSGNGVYSNYIHSNGNIAADGDINASGAMNASGNIASNAIMKGNTLSIGNAGSAFSYGLYQGSGFSVLQWSAGWVQYWEGATGNTYWSNAGGLGSNNMKLDGGGNLLLYNGNLTLQNAGARAYNYYGTSWVNLSDIRMKKNVQDYNAGLAEVVALRPVTFEWNGEGGPTDDGVTYHGMIAQEVAKVMPEMVHHMPSSLELEVLPDRLALDTTALPLALVNSVKALLARIESLEAEVAQLTSIIHQ